MLAFTVSTVPSSVRMVSVTPLADHELVARLSLYSTVKVTPALSAALLRE
jgi:hypothetical protein